MLAGAMPGEPQVGSCGPARGPCLPACCPLGSQQESDQRPSQNSSGGWSGRRSYALLRHRYHITRAQGLVLVMNAQNARNRANQGGGVFSMRATARRRLMGNACGKRKNVAPAPRLPQATSVGHSHGGGSAAANPMDDHQPSPILT